MDPSTTIARLTTVVVIAAASTACVGEFSIDTTDDPTPRPDLSRFDGGEADAGHSDDTGAQTDVGPSIDLGPTECMTPRAVFERETWPRAGKGVCTGCHLAGGVAENGGSTFILKDESSIVSEGMTLDEFYESNLAQFEQHAAERDDGMPTFIAKALGDLDHGGGEVVSPNSAAYQSLELLATSLQNDDLEDCVEPTEVEPLENIELLSPSDTFRKASMMLGSRLPTQAELDSLRGLPEDAALQQVEELLQPVMRSDAFHEWLKYAWNEIFMFRGLWELDVTFDFFVVSPTEFRARTWGFVDRGNFSCEGTWEGQTLWQRFAYPSLEVCQNRRFGRDFLSRRIAWSLMEGPLELIAWVVRNDRPFTEILTTDVVMMNYYSSVVYYGSAQPDDNPWVAEHLAGLPLDDLVHPGGSTIASIDLPFLHEFQPMTTVRRNIARNPQDGNPNNFEYRAAAQYPRAGLLTSQLFLTRYPTTDTNVNRHRAWAYFLRFLGVDILALADRRGDPAEAELNSDQPTIDDPNCNVCHDVMDPVAGLFQDFGDDGRWRPNAAWPPPDQPNMLAPGNSVVGAEKGQLYDAQQTDRAPLQWLADRTVEDPRFATRMVRHAFLQLTGHEPMEAPSNADQPGWRGRMRAYEVQSEFLNELRTGFVASNYDMKWLYAKIILSPWFRAESLSDPDVADDADALASTSNFGDGDRLLTPFELHRKIEALLQRPWSYQDWKMQGANLAVIDPNAPANDFLLRFDSDDNFRYVDSIFRDMYGGIDFMNNTSRLVRPSSVMSATSRRIANELGCASVAQDFALEPRQRALFGRVERGQGPADNPDGVRLTVEELHARMLGDTTPEPDRVAATIELFDTVLARGRQAVEQGAASTALPPHCRATQAQPGQTGAFTPIAEDPDYSIRAWMAVMTYLALDPDFLYTW